MDAAVGQNDTEHVERWEPGRVRQSTDSLAIWAHERQCCRGRSLCFHGGSIWPALVRPRR